MSSLDHAQPMIAKRFTCEGCGKQYRWKPELAGRRVRCAKCAAIMTAPDFPPVDEEEDDLYELVPESRPARSVAEYEFQHDELPAQATVIAKPQAVAYRAIAPQLARKAELDNYIGDLKKDLYLPAALLLVGAGIEFTRALLMARAGTNTLAYASIYVGLSLAINTTVMLIGVLIAAKSLGISFGPIGTAILKLCAISIAPAALSSLLTLLFPGFSAALIGWALSLALYFALISYLFELDGQETWYCVLIIGLTRFILSLALAAMLFKLMR
jgi:hypothetical protein